MMSNQYCPLWSLEKVIFPTKKNASLYGLRSAQYAKIWYGIPVKIRESTSIGRIRENLKKFLRGDFSDHCCSS